MIKRARTGVESRVESENGASILEFAVENSPDNAFHAAPPDDHVLWEEGALRNAREVAMEQLLLSYEGGLRLEAVGCLYGI